MPFPGSERESCVRERVADRRCSWLASRSWDCVDGGCECALAKNWEAMLGAEGEEGMGMLLYRRRIVWAMARYCT